MKRSDFLKWSAMTPLSLAGFLSPRMFSSTHCPPTQTVTQTVTGPTTTVVSTVTQTVTTGTAPPPTFPASYFTGPLGSRNIVPATATGALLGLCSGKEGWTAQQQRDFMAQRRTDTGRNLDIIHGFGAPTNDNWNGVADWEGWAHSLGSVPFITIQGLSPTTTLAAVNAGNCDAAYAACASFLKTKPFRIMVRLFHEFSEPSTPWYVPDQATAPAFVSAFQRVVNIFKNNGASNVGFCWCPQEGGDRAIRDLCYPGDTFVDWVSSDAYNSDSGAYSTPTHSGWAEFSEIFGYTGLSATSCYEQYQARKPFIVAETGSKYDALNPARKGDWFRHIATVAKPAMPGLRGVVFFDVWQSNGAVWWVDAKDDGTVDATTYQGFKDFSHDPAWNVGVSGGPT